MVQGHSSTTGESGYFDAYFETGERCGPHKPITGGWVIKQRYYSAGTTVDQANKESFKNGVFTVPYLATYHCCMSARGKQGGYYDFTMSRNGGSNVVAAMGTRQTGVTSDGWESMSTCTTQRMAAGVTLQMNLESGASTDCAEETGWRYNRFTCFLVGP